MSREERMLGRRSILRGLSALPLVALTGCASFFAALPTVVSIIDIAQTVMTRIVGFVDSYFAAHPDDALRAKIDAGIQAALSALATLEAAMKVAKDVHDKDLQDALAAFQDAYGALLALVSSIGVLVSGSAALKAARPGAAPYIEVPAPAEFSLKDAQ